ncbi:MAG TPA: hypothetical protein VI702_06790 [Nitrospiria bacterium]
MDIKLASVQRLVGITMIIMGFLNVLMAFNYELDITPVMMFLAGVILFVHSSVPTWHKWGVIALAAAAGMAFIANPAAVGPWYKLTIFYGTLLTAIFFMLSHPVKKSPLP